MSGMRFANGMQIRWFSAKNQMIVAETLDKSLTDKGLKHRHHPGIMKPRTVEQPPWLLTSIRNILQDAGTKAATAVESGTKFRQHLHGRHVPLEDSELLRKLRKVQSLVKPKAIEHDTPLDENLLKSSKGRTLLKQNVYNWTPIQYDRETGISYLVGRSIQDYCVVYKVLNEIKIMDQNFKPTTLFDFGSGIGTVMWAASQFWFNTIKEYVCIDVSAPMNDLSLELIKTAKPTIDTNKIFYRQFLPACPMPTYDIVVSAYTLLELPNMQHRLEALDKLWRKTGRYLVIIEQGTNAGFKVINEARDYLLNYASKKSANSSSAHIFSPCPHDLQCPRFTSDDTPCNFEIGFTSLPISGTSKHAKERYSYVILKKGERPEDDNQWPRIVRPTLKRSRHVICRLCTASGTLDEQIFTTWKNGKNTYRCARTSEWGDRLPFEVEKAEEIVQE